MAFQPVMIEAVSSPAVVRPGDEFAMTFQLKNAGDSPSPFPCEAQVRFECEGGQKSFSARFTPSHPTDAWPAGAVLTEGPHAFAVPVDAPAGVYRVRVQFFEPYTLNAKPPEWQTPAVEAVTVAAGAPGAQSPWRDLPRRAVYGRDASRRAASRGEAAPGPDETPVPPMAAPVTLRTGEVAFHLDRETGAFRLDDLKAGVTWASNPFSGGFATLYLRRKEQAAHVVVDRLSLAPARGDAIAFQVRPEVDGADTGLTVEFEIRVEFPSTLRFSYACSNVHAPSHAPAPLDASAPSHAAPAEHGWSLCGVRLLDHAFWSTGAHRGAAVIPHRLGLVIEAGEGAPDVRQFAHYTVHREGYSMAFCGMTKEEAALLITWDDLRARLEVAHLPVDGSAPYAGASAGTGKDVALRGGERAVATEESLTPVGALLAPSLVFRGDRGSCTVRALGKGDYVAIARAYREEAKRRGLVAPWSEKRKRRPGVDLLKGAADFKPFVLRRTLPFAYRNPTDQEIVDVPYTAEEVAALAEHWRHDLEIDRAMVVLAGWIHRGYDNQHPDILPAAPEIGGDAGVARAARRIKACGYLFGLHDNYQDMYRDAPSWDEACLIHHRDGAPMKGGVWLGGQAYHMTGRAGLELARRPQNLPEVKRRFDPTAYFIDTTLASPLFESWAPTPQTKEEDLAARRELLDFAKELFGVVGSEEGTEWGVPHADYFEGMMSHKFRTPVDAPVVPLFPIVFGDCVQLLPHQADVLRTHSAKWVLDSILYAALPLYHFERHLYYAEGASSAAPEGTGSRSTAGPGSSEGLAPESVFARADGGWAEGMHPTDRFIKNTYEVLSHLNRAVCDSPMTDHARLAPDGSLQASRFGDVRVVVNYGPEEREFEGVLLPAYGFLIEGPTFLAFHALRREGVEYPGGALFTVRSLDGAPLERSQKVRIFHGFGPARIAIAGKHFDVAREAVVSIG